VIHANSELQHKLQLRCDDIILLSYKLMLSRLSPKHTLSIYIHKKYINESIESHNIDMTSQHFLFYQSYHVHSKSETL
jgi:hypothetical protein